MHQIYENESGSNLYPEIDRVQMSPSDRARAKAQMLRAQFIADLIVRAADGLKEAAGWATKPVRGWLAKSKTESG
jgi:predicted NUDIX family NTP pyrophosphohydrolase